MKSDPHQLAELERIRGLSAQRDLAQLVEQEFKLRSEIALLNEHRRMNHDADVGLQPMRAIGGHINWQSWIDRTQSELTLKLAQVLAKKQSLIALCRKNTGRTEALSQVAKNESLASKRLQAKKALERNLEAAVVSSTINRGAHQ